MSERQKSVIVPSLEELEQIFKNHDKNTCKCDCCIICFHEAKKENRTFGHNKAASPTAYKQGVGVYDGL